MYIYTYYIYIYVYIYIYTYMYNTLLPFFSGGLGSGAKQRSEHASEQGAGALCPAGGRRGRNCGNGSSQRGFSKGGFSNNIIIITHKLLNPLY